MHTLNTQYKDKDKDTDTNESCELSPQLLMQLQQLTMNDAQSVDDDKEHNSVNDIDSTTYGIGDDDDGDDDDENDERLKSVLSLLEQGFHFSKKKGSKQSIHRKD